ncbi:MAG TPA: ribonuclease H-like YkuK family protein [Acetomicrobium flavidum]|uniref:ribonuclease H-like YkuK family protein n=1 Tax=Acetomicrobium flavidum TaxID=49896 RepID=UPI002C08F2E1|nr:ribonuclease H-like YkuK family protein [Acetomicrobium flavidum]HOM31176.1 ribonuclease H-like YkuK family protein [Acetomicrobium flavidum]HPP14846.1 ribonuclease H-like YkuK family protein [Acetomicrobium flavidum]
MFISPTYGPLKIEQVIQRICTFMAKEGMYRIIVGTDSQPLSEGTLFVSAIVVHRIGRGGIYFYRKTYERRPYSVKGRILTETSMSLTLASEVLHLLSQDVVLFEHYRQLLEIHLDVGEKGLTREILNMVVGMVKGSGYIAHIKPEAFAASCVADKHTKSG